MYLHLRVSGHSQVCLHLLIPVYSEDVAIQRLILERKKSTSSGSSRAKKKEKDPL